MVKREREARLVKKLHTDIPVERHVPSPSGIMGALFGAPGVPEGYVDPAFDIPRNAEAQRILEQAKDQIRRSQSYLEMVTVPLDSPEWRVYYKDSLLFIADGNEGAEIVESSEAEPVLLREREGRAWWLFRNNIYSTKEDLEPDEIAALIGEQESKKRSTIARAKTVAAMTDQLDRRGQRQPIPREVKVAVWQRDQGRCVQCGSNEALEFDHIIPHSKGGADTERNIQLLCAACNREKGASL
jgi:hypothetical protein